MEEAILTGKKSWLHPNLRPDIHLHLHGILNDPEINQGEALNVVGAFFASDKPGAPPYILLWPGNIEDTSTHNVPPRNHGLRFYGKLHAKSGSYYFNGVKQGDDKYSLRLTPTASFSPEERVLVSQPSGGNVPRP